MPTINPDLPEDGEDASVVAYNPAIIAILALLNGQIDGDNIAPGSLPWSVMDSFSGEIPAAALEDDANSVKFRDEFGMSRVVTGLETSATSGLNGAVTTGIAYTANGLRHSVPAVTSKTFTASKDTYVDVGSNGAINYTEVANNATPPPIDSDSVRIAMVVTNGTEITHVHDMRVLGNQLACVKVGNATTLLTLTFPAKRYLKITVIAIATGGTLDAAARFNNDSGANYARKATVNGSAIADLVSANSILLESGSTDPNQMQTTWFEVTNISNKEKNFKFENVSQDAAGGATPPVVVQAWGKWANTTQDLVRFDFFDTTSNNRIGPGSEIVVEGWD